MLFVPYLFASSFKIKSPTSSYTSAPSKLPIVPSNLPSLSFFTQGDPLWSRIDFLEYMIISVSWLVNLVCFLAKWIALVSSSEDMEG